MRVKLTIEYDGTDYAGWQRQDNLPTVQGALENALRALLQTDISLTVAGRTDAGVHAEGQVAHFDADDLKGLQGGALSKGINAHLRDHTIAVIAAEAAADDFHARFSAVNKLYRYTIVNRAAKPALRQHAWHVRQKLDEAKMHEAAQAWLGRHDFTSFRDSECQAKSPVKTLDRLDVTRHGDVVVIEAEARSFLHHQMRNMAGTLVEFGMGKREVSESRAVLDAADRRLAGPTAPPQGLVLVRVDYP